jgi:hypothetical protein
MLGTLVSTNLIPWLASGVGRVSKSIAMKFTSYEPKLNNHTVMPGNTNNTYQSRPRQATKCSVSF